MSAAMMLERFLFDGVLQYSQIKKLSGGEKRRLYLLKVLMEAPNILILDEPTRGIDVGAKKEIHQLIEKMAKDYLERFPGILIMVSHDRYFLDKTAERLFAFGENGRLRQYEGGYSAYLELRQREAGVPVSPVRTERASEQKTEKVKTAKLKFTWQEQKDYDSIEAEIEKIEEKIADLEQKIQLAATDFMKLNELTQEKEAQEGLLEAKMERYIYLSDLAERIREQE